MFKKLTLKNFKNFQDAELTLGPFTVLVGANATGKSNIREAFRFLHGIGRGYSLSEIIGEKWADGGEKIWTGIRGGTQELFFSRSNEFSLETTLHIQFPIDYSVAFYKQTENVPPQLTYEAFGYSEKEPVFVKDEYWGEYVEETLGFAYHAYHFGVSYIKKGIIDLEKSKNSKELLKLAKIITDAFHSMRFFDFSPDFMRIPSLPGQTVLGDRGENLSSVLYDICQEPQQKQTLLGWLEGLLPMKIDDLEFPTDQIGRVLVTMVESDGRRVTAYSLSDGTLRVLAMLASFLGPKRAAFYFFEELENGIHPSRLHLLIELIEQVTAEGNIQVVTTTHSPQLLGLVSEQTLENASMTYRLEGQSDAHIQRIVDIPGAKEIFQEEDLSRLYEKGWLENSVHFMQNLKEPA